MNTTNQVEQTNDQNVLQNYSCVTEREKNDSYHSIKTRIPLSNVRLFTHTEEFTKNKIMELQEELLKLRKQVSHKQCLFSKEKSNLLNKIQILSEQNTEIRHRQQSLIQLNQTLELAIKTKQQTNSKTKQLHQIESLRGQLQGKNKMIKELKRTLEQLRKHLKNLEDQKYRMNEEKDKQIGELRLQNKRLLAQREAQVTTLKNLLSSRQYNKEMVGAIYKALNIHISKDLSFEDIEAESHYFNESPITKRKLQGEKRVGGRSSNILDTSYSALSNRSFIYELNSNKNLKSQCSQDYQDQDMLLCQVCKKVFQEKQFIYHMQQCREMNQLQKKRQQLQKAIEVISHQQRTSVSQKKSRVTKFNQAEPQRDKYNTQRSKSKLQKKKTYYQQQNDNYKKIVVQLKGNQGVQANYQNFKSNKYY